jgi:hypothetical protein
MASTAQMDWRGSSCREKGGRRVTTDAGDDEPAGYVFGMPVMAGRESPLRSGQPLAAVTAVKVLGSDDVIWYDIVATEKLSTVEALGMIEMASARLRRQF